MNVPVPVCDRISVNNAAKVLLTDFLVGTGASVTIPSSSTLVVLFGDNQKTFYIYSRATSTSVNVSNGARYYIFSGTAYVRLF